MNIRGAVPITENHPSADFDSQFYKDSVEAGLETSFRDRMNTLLQRRWLILGIVILSLAVGFAVSLKARTYTANGTLRIEVDAASMLRTSPLAGLSGNDSNQIMSEAQILQSRTLYLRVAKQLDLLNNPAFWGLKQVKPASLDDPKARESVFRRMHAVIAVKHAATDNLIQISCTTISPSLSAKITNSLINEYIENLFRMRFGSTKRVSDWLVGQLDGLKQQVENDQANIIDLQHKLGVIGINEQNAEYLQTQSLNSITTAANQATIERIVAEARLRTLQESDSSLLEGEVNLLSPSQAGSPQAGLLQSLRNSQAQAASNYARLQAQFGPNYPEVRQQRAQLDELNRQVKTEEQRILNQAKVSYNGAKTSESLQNELLQRKTEQTFKSGDQMAKYMLLLHDYQSRRGLYEQLVQRLREQTITSGLEAGEVDVVDLADLPVIPNPPGPLTILGASLLAGLFAGCLIAIALNAIDGRITTIEQAERAMNLPVLSLIPHLEFKNISQSGAGPSGQGSFIKGATTSYTEALQMLRSSILLARPGSAPKTIMITSAVPGEGKSITSRNLAAAFARHRSRVLLIDADLRRGQLSRTLGLPGNKGLSNLLTNKMHLFEAIQTVPEVENLSVLPSGPYPPDPAVLICSSEMTRVIQECVAEFDFVIIDAPPVFGLSDAVNLGQLVDVAISVVRERFSTRKAIQETARRMMNARVPLVGLVLNDVDTRFHAYSYGYEYRTYADYYGDGK